MELLDNYERSGVRTDEMIRLFDESRASRQSVVRRPEHNPYAYTPSDYEEFRLLMHQQDETPKASGRQSFECSASFDRVMLQVDKWNMNLWAFFGAV